MTPLKAALFAVTALALSAGAAAGQEPTRVTIDLSTAGAQPGAPPVSQRSSTPSTYTPPAPQRALLDDGPALWNSQPSAWATAGGSSADGLAVVRTKTFFTAKPMDFAGPAKGESLLALSIVSLVEGVADGALSDSGFITTPFKVTGPVQSASGPLKPGEALVSAPVVHQLRGRLKAPIDHMMGVKLIPVGTEFYGVEMQLFGLKKARYGAAATNGATIWCAPKPTKAGALEDADCFVPVSDANGSTFHYWQMAPNWPNLRFNDTSSASRTLDIEEEPTEAGAPMMGSVRFVKWKSQTVTVRFSTQANGVFTEMSHDDIKRQPDGSALVKAFGGIFRLTPAGPKGADARIEMVQPPLDAAADIIAQADAPYGPG